MIAVREGSYKVSEYEVRLRTRIWVMGTVQCALRANVSTTLRESVRNLKVQLEDQDKLQQKWWENIRKQRAVTKQKEAQLAAARA